MRRGLRLLAAIAAAAVFLSPPPAAPAAERIRNYESLITVHDDGALSVEERITVSAAGVKIKRGIFRTFPTRYRDRFGGRVTVPFTITRVLRDGRPEPYHTEKTQNGVKIYMGRKDVFLDPGEYSYSLSYRTGRHLGFFDEYDELYWNVTGNDWDFLIEKAAAEIRLPPGARILDTHGYTGPKGAKGGDYTASDGTGGTVRFETTRPLQPGEGLTVAVSWPKGVVHEPTAAEKREDYLRDNTSAAAALAGLAVVLLYYLVVWILVGKDPPRGTIVPLFAPPEGYSPAAVRYVMRMGYSHRVFAAALVSMAVKGYLTINEEEGKYTFSHTGAEESILTRGELKIANKLFSGRRSFPFVKGRHREIGKAIEAFKKSLQTDFELLNFKRNGKLIIPGILLTLLALGGIVVTATDSAGALGISLWLTFWSVGCVVLLVQVGHAWLGVWRGGAVTRALQVAGALFITFFSLPLLGGEVFGFYLLSVATSIQSAALFLLMVILNPVFLQLLKAPTIRGRKVMDRIEGFKMFLEAAEQDRLDRMNPPEKTPQLFETFLPYALALDVEVRWCDQFAEVLSTASAASGERAYRPSWYSGRAIDSFSAPAMAAGLGTALSGAISSASTAPGSSSGSGGGGSSGGGGGGGGGGGW